MKNFLHFPLDMLCIFFMVLSFGKENTDRMLKTHKKHLLKELIKIKGEGIKFDGTDNYINIPVINVDKIMWENIKKAAAESNWIPPEYMMNDWVSDVQNYLKNGGKI